MGNEISIIAKHSNRDRRLVWVFGIALGFAFAALAPGNAIAVGDPIEIQVAYLDPGTGSMILQAIVATVAGAAVVITTYWQKIRTFFRRRSRNSEPSETAPSDD
jgi:hypothetical protein